MSVPDTQTEEKVEYTDPSEVRELRIHRLQQRLEEINRERLGIVRSIAQLNRASS